MIFTCPHCAQPLDVPKELEGSNIECPTCKQAIHIPHPARNAVIRSDSASPRRIFHYVFWSTVSLGLTLVILLVALVFFTGVFSGVVATTEAVVTKPLEVAKRVDLPPLTAFEAQVASNFIKEFYVSTDKIEGRTWYLPPLAEIAKTGSYLYIAAGRDGDFSLRWAINYAADDWLFVETFRIKTDRDEPFTVTPHSSVSRQSGKAGVLESFDEPAISHADSINRILVSETCQVRIKGSETFEDIELDAATLQKMRNVLLVYRYWGGKWSVLPEPRAVSQP